MQKLPKGKSDKGSPVELRGLARLGLWGAAAACSLLIAAIATYTETGQRRIMLALHGGAAQPQISAIEEERRNALRDTQTMNQRLADQVRNLAQDRDRLVARLTSLERNYEDVTGSITRLANPPKAVSVEPAAPPVAVSAPPPEIAPVASIPAVNPDRPAPGGNLPAAAQPPAAIPAPPPPVAAAAPDAVDNAAPKAEFGLDLGSAPSVAALRVAWDRIRRTYGAQLEGLRPVIGIRDGRSGQVELRLVVGPISSAATATRLCTSLAAAGLSCQPTSFEGQRLALR